MNLVDGSANFGHHSMQLLVVCTQSWACVFDLLNALVQQGSLSCRHSLWFTSWTQLTQQQIEHNMQHVGCRHSGPPLQRYHTKKCIANRISKPNPNLRRTLINKCMDGQLHWRLPISHSFPSSLSSFYESHILLFLRGMCETRTCWCVHLQIQVTNTNSNPNLTPLTLVIASH